MSESLQPFKENVHSYCSRILADSEQLRYIVQTMKFSTEREYVRHHIEAAQVYVEKIQEHLNSLEKL